jgi:uncharacterized protein YydD (DUF2326 family)
MTASDPRFQGLELRPGFNLIVARKSPGAARTDSTNALGKSAVPRLMHFLLGASPEKGRELPAVRALTGWSFAMEIELHGQRLHVERAVDSPSVIVHNAPAGWGEPQLDGSVLMKTKEWREFLRQHLFGLAEDEPGPSARQLLPYLVRYEPANFAHPFKSLKGSVADSQVATAWLLGLPVSLPLEYQQFEERIKDLKAVKTRVETTGYPGMKATRAALQAEQARLTGLVRRLETERSKYELREQSMATRARADELTRQFNELRDQLAETDALLRHYREAASEGTMPASADLVTALFDEAAVWLPEKVTRRLSEVQQFHEQLITNRARFLERKITELQRKRTELQPTMERVDRERAPLLATLAEDGAIEAYTATHSALTDARTAQARVEAQLDMLKGVEGELQETKHAQSLLTDRAVVLHDEYLHVQQRAQTLFSEYVRSAFHEEGRLEIDLTDPRYRFKVDIPGIESGGVSKLAVACVDLMIARLLHDRRSGPGLLVHDSPIFESMDARQVAGTLNTAWRESTACGYTYLALLNEDQLLRAQEHFDMPNVDDYVRLTFRDRDDTGGLFGFRFG